VMYICIFINILTCYNLSLQLLGSGSTLAQGHWISSYTYPERLPLPFILGAVYGVRP